MTRRPRSAVVLLFVFSLTGPVVPAGGQTPDEAFRKDIERLLDVTGSTKMGVQMATMMSGQVMDGLLRQHDIPQKAIDLAKAVVNEEITRAFEGPDSMTAEIARLYAKHFTHEEVKGLLAFYETRLGQKMIAVTPALLQESVTIGQTWSQRIMPRLGAQIENRLRAEGYIK